MIFSRVKKTVVFYLILLIIVAVGVFAIFKYTKGLGIVPFGGYVVSSFPCTCPSSAGTFLLTFTPFFNGGPAPTTGQLVYDLIKTRQAYLNYNLPLRGVWALGLYTPGGA